MLPDSFSLRRAGVAYLFPAQPELKRKDALDYYDAVTGAGVELQQFNHQGNIVQLLRESSGNRPNTFKIEVGQHQTGMFRMMVSEEWPNRSLQIIGQDADIAWNCFREAWPKDRIGETPALVECNFRSTVATRGDNATRFLAEDVFRIPEAAYRKLGRQPQGLGLRLMLGVQVSDDQSMGSIPLNGAGGDVRVETLQDDPSRLYVEVKVRWPSGPIPSELQRRGAPSKLNPETFKPSEYFDLVDGYMKDELTQFLLTATGGE